MLDSKTEAYEIRTRRIFYMKQFMINRAARGARGSNEAQSVPGAYNKIWRFIYIRDTARSLLSQLEDLPTITRPGKIGWMLSITDDAGVIFP
ncbi:jg11606 [Pararge aegeria aegeria]|uniref:Jg11606 protein n=1 Tax=Pararge aegeria aegeria TaxID=348720 RepID=A0A8S4RTE7_9NEOP|nr:jg11606 [Pararge aegeria aegeria]